MPINSENEVEYLVNKDQDQDIIDQALAVLATRIRKPGQALTSLDDTANYLKLQLAHLDYEVFFCLFLDTKHRVIDGQTLFNGTINGCSVHPRVVVKKCLSMNAAAVIFTHNHPSGGTEPSDADRDITTKLQSALELFDIKVLDHIVIGGVDHVSFAERGLL